MPDDRDAGLDDAFDVRRHGDPALQLDAVGPGFLHDPAGCHESLLGIQLIGHEGQVSDDHRVRRAAPHRLDVVDDFVEGDGVGVLEPLDDHAERVSDEDQLRRRLVHQARHRVVVDGDHGDLLPAPLRLAEGGDRALRFGCRRFNHNGSPYYA